MRLLLPLCAILALAVGVSGAMAGGGNSANAKKCQKGGWQSLYTSTGGTFANEQECVGYAAKGGTLTTTAPNPYPLSKAACEAVSGTYAVASSFTGWTCTNWVATDVIQSNSTDITLAVNCFHEVGPVNISDVQTGPFVYPTTFTFTCGGP